ncbi:MAG: cytochrome c3 family protein [Proteobacteria bacterium]|nr:cytochrome c3 family protein [Pseudomonadota bacterium]
MPARLAAKALTVFAIAMALLVSGAPARAQNSLERLVMPGALIEGHAKLETECSKCHSPFSPKAQNDLCLDCHKPIAADISARRGLHGMRPDAQSSACRQCHSEHKGRKADIVRSDPATFDHSKTNFALVGRHASTSCQGCHEAGKKHRAAPSACIDCHRSADPHRGQVASDCSGCHSAEGWTSISNFDHEKTKFSLTGAHREVACRSCHVGERYKGLSTVCGDCHQQRDIHQGRNGPKCNDCHKTTDWKFVSFDHDVNTKFPLLGKHRDTTCNKCHEQDPRRVRLETKCIACHVKDDAKAHKGQLGKDCLGCHGEAGWKKDVKFDHDRSRFPLTGAHVKAKCEDCHKARTYKDAPTACAGCHNDKKSHDGRLGSDCAQCHTSIDWKKARFDHDRQTRFKLTGKHAQATCYSCHNVRNLQKIKLSGNCYDCHKLQDRHKGAFGRNCGVCHSMSTFGTAFIRN